MSEPPFDEKNAVQTGLAIFGEAKRQRVHADARGLTIAEGALLPSDRIARAYLVPRSGEKPRVFVDPVRGSQIRIEVLTRGEGERLLRALGWSLEQRAIRFRAQTRPWVLLVLAVALASIADQWFRTAPTFFSTTLVSAALLAAVLFAVLTRPVVEVGADGVTIHGFLRRFLSYRDIASVRLEHRAKNRRGGTLFVHDLVFQHRSRSPVRVRMAYGDISQPQLDGAIDRVRSAMAIFHGRPLTHVPHELARAGKSTKDWITSLRSLASASNDLGYRAPAIDPEALFAIVESPAESHEVRAAAAVALAKSEDPTQRDRLKKSLETVVEPKLRVAFEAATTDDDEALEEALGELDAKSTEPKSKFYSGRDDDAR